MNDSPEARTDLLAEPVLDGTSAHAELNDLGEHQLVLPGIDLTPSDRVDGLLHGARLDMSEPALPCDVHPANHPLKIEISISPDSSAVVFVRGPVHPSEFLIEGLYNFLVGHTGIMRVSLYKLIE